jgi:hypothetical protein
MHEITILIVSQTDSAPSFTVLANVARRSILPVAASYGRNKSQRVRSTNALCALCSCVDLVHTQYDLSICYPCSSLAGEAQPHIVTSMWWSARTFDPWTQHTICDTHSCSDQAHTRTLENNVQLNISLPWNTFPQIHEHGRTEPEDISLSLGDRQCTPRWCAD